jgi:MinD superfamily P-loop ATPase
VSRMVINDGLYTIRRTCQGCGRSMSIRTASPENYPERLDDCVMCRPVGSNGRVRTIKERSGTEMAKKKAKEQIVKKQAVKKQPKSKHVVKPGPEVERKARRPRSGGPSLIALKREVKEKHPEIKGLVDATREELAAVIKDPKDLAELQAVLAKRKQSK